MMVVPCEIARLRAENEALRITNGGMRDIIAHMSAEVDKLRRESAVAISAAPDTGWVRRAGRKSQLGLCSSFWAD